MTLGWRLLAPHAAAPGKPEKIPGLMVKLNQRALLNFRAGTLREPQGESHAQLEI